MKKILLVLAVGCCAMTASAAGLNVFASELNSSTPNSVEFLLNDEADVVLNLIDNGTVIGTIEVGHCNKGHNTFEITHTDIPAGTYNWSITAIAAAVTEAALVGNCTTDEVLQIANTRGLAIDNNPASKFFGHIYATSIAANKKTGARQGTGIYILNAALQDFAEQGNTPYSCNVSWDGTNSSPMRVAVAENSDLYIGDWSDSHSGVWVMNPEDTSIANPVLGGARNDDGLASVDGVDVHGSIVDICLVGSGAEFKMYTADEDMPNVLNRYDLGESTAIWETAPSATWANVTGFINKTDCIESDRNGGIWLCQNRYDNGTQYPSLLHLNGDGELDYSMSDIKILPGSYPGAAMGVSRDGKTLAVADGKSAYVFDVDFSDGVPALTRKHKVSSPASARPFKCDFDAAGNLYVAYNDDNGGICQFAIPKDNNEFTTPARGTMELTIQTGVFEEVVNSAIQYRSGIISAAEGAEVFNALGAKVAEGTEISTEGLAAGVYIVRTGNQTLKIIR